MQFERENHKAIGNPSAKKLALELNRLHGFGKSSFASLTAQDGSYLQVAGGRVNCVLEWRDARERRHFRAFQEPPVVPYPDGTKLTYSGGTVLLRKNEWFFIEDVIDAFIAFAEQRAFPSKIQWREVTAELQRNGVYGPAPSA